MDLSSKEQLLRNMPMGYIITDGVGLGTFWNYFGPHWITITGEVTSHKIAKRRKHKRGKLERAYVCVNKRVLFLQATPMIKMLLTLCMLLILTFAFLF